MFRYSQFRSPFPEILERDDTQHILWKIGRHPQGSRIDSLAVWVSQIVNLLDSFFGDDAPVRPGAEHLRVAELGGDHADQ
jgi:hypothetical protein